MSEGADPKDQCEPGGSELRIPDGLAVIEVFFFAIVVLILAIVYLDYMAPSKTLFVVSAKTSRFEYAVQKDPFSASNMFALQDTDEDAPTIFGRPIKFDQFSHFSFKRKTESSEDKATTAEGGLLQYVDTCFTGELTPVAGTQVIFSTNGEGLFVEIRAKDLDTSILPSPIGTLTEFFADGRSSSTVIYDSATLQPHPDCLLGKQDEQRSTGDAGAMLSDLVAALRDVFWMLLGERGEQTSKGDAPVTLLDLPTTLLDGFSIEGPGSFGTQLVRDEPQDTWRVSDRRTETLSGTITSIHRSVFCGDSPRCKLNTAFQNETPIPSGATLMASTARNLPPKRYPARYPHLRERTDSRPIWRGNLRLQDGLLLVDVSTRAEELRVVRPIVGSDAARAEYIRPSLLEKIAGEPVIQLFASVFAFFVAGYLSMREVSHEARWHAAQIPRFCRDCAVYIIQRGRPKAPPQSKE